jgi:Arc/MetJ-type ribon-helix-helix transcriptional regulator
VRALCEGVNTCVRSSRAVNAYSSASDALKSALEMILHRVAMRLALPTGERRAVVRDDEL